MRLQNIYLCLLLCGLSLPSAWAEEPEPLRTVPTFECLSLYYPSTNPEPCQIRYREAGSEEWKAGLDLVFDPRDNEHRGSLVYLRAGTEYEIELTQGELTIPHRARTESDAFPIG
ncbi:MAG: hypothetical protein RBU29_11390, partial [bacterium]|nr:hypothetical protein [bacterium]